ncbi:LEA type 2 family protein [Candidatus Saganbacteria bacterium]|nr:LEA type 2 family protein [Candidatus Saganbacteria bacterium]
MKNIFFGSILLIILIGLTGCISVESPKITYIDTDVRILSVTTVQATSHFKIKNPNPVGMQGSVEYDLYLKGQKFTSGVTSTIDLLPNGETGFTLESRVDLAKALGTTAELIAEVAAGKKSVPYKISGKFKSNLAGILVEAPVEAAGDLPLPSASSLIKISF